MPAGATAIEEMCIPSLKVRSVRSVPLRMNCAIVILIKVIAGKTG